MTPKDIEELKYYAVRADSGFDQDAYAALANPRAIMSLIAKYEQLANLSRKYDQELA